MTVETNERFLSGRTAWVTGSSRGIGRVIAGHLARLGADVAVHGTTPTSTRAFDEAPSLQAVADAIAGAHGTRVTSVHGDLTDEAVVGDVVGQIRRRLGPIDVLVACAGGDIGAGGTRAPNGGKPRDNDAVAIAVDDVRSVLDRNLMTCILCCRAVAPAMMERRVGHIVAIGSDAGTSGRAESAIYATAKAAVHAYCRCLAAQMRPYHVPVNVVAPGPIVTPRFVATRETDEGQMAREGTFERYGWPLDVARAVAFLVSPACSFTTGQVLRVDGGRQLWPA